MQYSNTKFVRRRFSFETWRKRSLHKYSLYYDCYERRSRFILCESIFESLGMVMACVVLQHFPGFLFHCCVFWNVMGDTSIQQSLSMTVKYASDFFHFSLMC